MESKFRTGFRSAKAAMLLALVTANGCHPATHSEGKLPVPVHTAEVTLEASPEDLRNSASVLPFAEATLSFKTSGYVIEIRQAAGADGRRRDVGPGDFVSRGTVLAQIRHQDLKNRLDQAAATLGKAQALHVEATQDYQRAKTLYVTQSLTKPDFDQAQAQLDSTQASVDQANAAAREAALELQDADLRAPFSGYVLTRSIELGNLAAPGTTAFTIADISAVKIAFGVSDDTVTRLRLGQEISIRTQSDPKEFKGRITSIGASADEKNRVFPIEVTVPNPQSLLKPGMIASLIVPGVIKVPSPSIPLSAVTADPAAPGQYAVFVADQVGVSWVAHLRQVTLGEIHENGLTVNGVKPGEKVVVAGTAGLKDGDSITVLQ